MLNVVQKKIDSFYVPGIYLPREKRAETFYALIACFLLSKSRGLTLFDALKEVAPLLTEDQVGAVDVLIKASQSPAATNQPTWGADLVTEILDEWHQSAARESVALKLALTPQSYVEFEGWQSLSFPRRRENGASLAGGFRAEGDPVRTGGLTLTAATLTPRSMGILCTLTNEALQRAEGLLDVIRDAMVTDTAAAIDPLFFSSTPGTAISPPGIWSFCAPGALIPGSPFPEQDLKECIRNVAWFGQDKLVWVMPESVRILLLSLRHPVTEAPRFPDLPFGVLYGHRVLTGPDVPATTATLLRPADLRFGWSLDTVRVSDETLVVEDDTSPVQVGDALAGGAGSQPVRSLMQSNSSACRALYSVDWTLLRSVGDVAAVADTSQWV